MESSSIKVICKEQFFGNDFHPLHVAVPYSIFQEFCQSNDTNELICAISWTDVRLTSIFVVVHPMLIVEEIKAMLVTALFLNHYGLTVGQEVLLNQVSTFPLSKVVFGVQKKEDFQVLKNLFKDRGFLFELQRKKHICRQGDVCLLSDIIVRGLDYQSMLTLECLPFHQGSICRDTSVILVEIGESVVKKSSLLKDKKDSSLEFQNVAACLNVLNYSSQIVLSYISNHPQEKWLFDQHFNSFKIQYNELNQQLSLPHLSVHVLPSCPFKNDKVPGIVDKSAVVFIAESILNQFDIADKSWVDVEIYRTKTHSSSRKSSVCYFGSRHSSSSSSKQQARKTSFRNQSGDDNTDSPARAQHHSGSESSPTRKCGKNQRPQLLEDFSSPNIKKDVRKRSTADSNISNITFDDIVNMLLTSSSGSVSRVRRAQVFSLCERNYQHLDLSLFHQTNTAQAFVSPLFWFNLNSQPSDFIQPDARICIKVRLFLFMLQDIY